MSACRSGETIITITLRLARFTPIVTLSPVYRFYCKVPYLLAVVSYKPFAIPMWACITICCPYTFAEYTFGNHPRGRDASGTCLASSIPRNIFSIGLVFIITGLLGIWVAVALFAYAPLLLAFGPVLILPAFCIPFLAVYAPTKSLDCAVSRAGRRAKNDAKVFAPAHHVAGKSL